MLQQRSKHPREMVITPKAPTSLFVRSFCIRIKVAPLVGVYQSRDGFGYVRTRKGDNYGAAIYTKIATCTPYMFFIRMPNHLLECTSRKMNLATRALERTITMMRPYYTKITQTSPSVSFHRCRCVNVKCVERVLSVLEAKDSEAVLGVWRPAPLQTSRAPPYRARFGRWREERFGRASMFDLAV